MDALKDCSGLGIYNKAHWNSSFHSWYSSSEFFNTFHVAALPGTYNGKHLRPYSLLAPWSSRTERISNHFSCSNILRLWAKDHTTPHPRYISRVSSVELTMKSADKADYVQSEPNHPLFLTLLQTEGNITPEAPSKIYTLQPSFHSLMSEMHIFKWSFPPWPNPQSKWLPNQSLP